MRPPSRSELATCFIGSNIVALGAGTPYMYSFYAPQLLAKCNLPVSELSTLSLAMSLGSTLLGFFAGMVIDRNVVVSCLLGAISTFSAYSILHYCYVHELANVPLIAFGLALVGFGSVSGFYAAVKCCTTNFPHHRGTAGSFPVSLYALSGMLFSAICTKVFKDDIEKIFVFLTYVCSAMIFVGCLTMRIMVTPDAPKVKKRRLSANPQNPNVRSTEPGRADTIVTQPIAISSRVQENGNSGNSIPASSQNRTGSLSSNSSSSLASSFQSLFSTRRSDSFVWSKDLTGSLSFWGWGRVRDDSTQPKNPSDLGFASSPSPPTPLSKARPSYSSTHSSPQHQRLNSFTKLHRSDSFKRDQSSLNALQKNKNIEEFMFVEEAPRKSDQDSSSSWRDSHLFQTVKKPRFIIYVTILATLQGIGQMYIYSVGFIVQTQVHSSPAEDVNLNPEAIQSLQVSIISTLSFLGRLSSGPVSDLLVKKFKAQRLWNIVIAGLMFICASYQMLKSSTVFPASISDGPDNIRNISLCSAIFGYAFGVLFGTFPPIIADAFGTAGFSTIWGLATSGGLFTVKCFCSVLGSDLQRNSGDGKSYCEKGSQCYNHTFHVTAIWAAIITSMTLVVIGITYWKREYMADKVPDEHRTEYILAEDEEETGNESSPV